jgi:hypothetical protein
MLGAGKIPPWNCPRFEQLRPDAGNRLSPFEIELNKISKLLIDEVGKCALSGWSLIPFGIPIDRGTRFLRRELLSLKQHFAAQKQSCCSMTKADGRGSAHSEPESWSDGDEQLRPITACRGDGCGAQTPRH